MEEALQHKAALSLFQLSSSSWVYSSSLPGVTLRLCIFNGLSAKLHLPFQLCPTLPCLTRKKLSCYNLAFYSQSEIPVQSSCLHVPRHGYIWWWEWIAGSEFLFGRINGLRADLSQERAVTQLTWGQELNIQWIQKTWNNKQLNPFFSLVSFS